MQQLPRWLTTIPIAHRGLHAEYIPENSIASFENAIGNGYAIELDVQVTADQIVVVFHDADLMRMCSENIRVDRLTEIDLKKHRLERSTEPIPELRDVLRLVNGRVPLLIEIKSQSRIKNRNSLVLQTLSGYRGEVAIQSFNPMILGWFARKAPHLCRGQLSSDFRNVPMNGFLKDMLRSGALNFISRPHFLAYDVKALPQRWIERKRKMGMAVLAWTVTSVEMNERMKAHCDNIIFEGFRPSIP